MAYAQATRRLQIETPLGEDVLLVRSFSGGEGLSQLFHFELELMSENDSISYDAIVGKDVTVGLALSDDEQQRFWNGYVSKFYQAGRDASLAVYRATVVPPIAASCRTGRFPTSLRASSASTASRTSRNALRAAISPGSIAFNIARRISIFFRG